MKQFLTSSASESRRDRLQLDTVPISLYQPYNRQTRGVYQTGLY